MLRRWLCLCLMLALPWLSALARAHSVLHSTGGPHVHVGDLFSLPDDHEDAEEADAVAVPELHSPPDAPVAVDAPLVDGGLLAVLPWLLACTCLAGDACLSFAEHFAVPGCVGNLPLRL